jgi:hypothetical protein
MSRAAAQVPAGYQGTITLAVPGADNGPFSPSTVADFDLATGQLTARFQGIDPTRAPDGEVAFIHRLQPGYTADHAVVVADPKGVLGPPLSICKDYNVDANQVCITPKLSPNTQLVAFGRRGPGQLCHNNFGTFFGDFVTVVDRHGNIVSSFEGFTYPEWFPNGQLLMLGTECRNAGIWITDAALRNVARVDDQITTPARAPAVSPDGSTVAFVWNGRVWTLGQAGLSDVTPPLQHPVFYAGWSPDGSALAALTASINADKALVLFRPGDAGSVVTLRLPTYPSGPLSWR